MVWQPPGFAAGLLTSAKAQGESRTLPQYTVAKFANLGKGQGIPLPVGNGSGMGSRNGRETDGHRMWSATRADRRATLLVLPSLLPGSLASPSSQPASSVPGLMIPLSRGPLVFSSPQVRPKVQTWKPSSKSCHAIQETWLLRENTRHPPPSIHSCPA